MALGGFDKDYYLGVKLVDIQKKHPEEWKDKTAADLEKFLMDDHNLTPEQHYQKYGYKEMLAPNQFFDPEEYVAAKIKQMVSSGKFETEEKAKEHFSANWTEDPYLHYLKYGHDEGVNPSNDFDETAYVDAKVKEMVAKGKYPDEASAKAAFKASGLSAIQHYLQYGKDEAGIDPIKVPDAEQVVIPGGTYALTTADDILIPAGAALPEGVKEEAVKRTTSDADTITAVSSSLSSERTLDTTDQIDGGDGKDTIKIDMKSSFSGFTGNGKMVNVEVLDLSNSSSIARTFDTTGATGITNVIVDGSNGGITSVTDLNTLAALNLSGQASGSFTLGYDSKSVVNTGTQKDIQEIMVKDVGTAKVAATPTTSEVAAKYIALTIAGVESSTIDSAGTANYLDLTNLAGTAITLTGSAATYISAVNTALTSFDAQKATGNITADLTNVATAGSLKSVATGSGDDTITISVADIAATAELNGGAGTDTLKIASGGAATIQPTMAGFETLEVGAITGDLMLSAKNSSDLATLVVDGAGGDVTLVNSPSAALTVKSIGAEGTSRTITTDNSGASIVSYEANATELAAKTGVANKTKVQLNNSSDVTIKVGPYIQADTDSAVTATKATNVTLEVMSGKNSSNVEQTKFAGDITATVAETFTVNATGELATDSKITASAATSGKVTSGATGDFIIDAAKLETLEIDANGGLDLQTSTLSALQVLTADTDGHLNMTGVALAKASTVNLSGINAASQATLNNLGSSSLDYDISLIATGLKGGLTTGTINAGTNDVTVDVNGVTGAISLGTITGADITIKSASTLGTIAAATLHSSKSATITGAEIKANEYTVQTKGTSFTSSFTGGLYVDKYTVNAEDASNTATITLTGAMGLGANVLKVDASLETTVGVTIDVTGMDVGTDAAVDIDLIGGTQADTIKGTAAKDEINGGAGADNLYGYAGDDTFVFDAAGEVASTEQIDGGTGTDTLKIDGNAITIDFKSATSIKSIEALTFANTVGALTTEFDFSMINTQDGSTITGMIAKDLAVTASAQDNTLTFKADTTDNVDLSSMTFTDWTTGGTDTINITGDADSNTIIGSSKDDVITGAGGTDTLTGGAGANDFVMNDLVKDATTIEMDTITDFTVANTDQIGNFSLADLEALTALTDLVSVGTGTTSLADTNPVAVASISGATDLGAALSAKNVLVLNANLADTDAVETAIEDGGTLELTANGGFSAGDGFLVVYDDGANSYIALATLANNVADDAKIASSDATVQNLVTLTGVTDANTIADANFLNFVA